MPAGEGMVSGVPPKRATGLFYGWWIIVIGGVVNAVGGGIGIYGFSIFFLPISRDIGLSRAATSLVFSLARAEGALEGPVAGWMVDRVGPRAVLFVAASIIGVGYIVLSRVDSYLTLLLVYIGIISFGSNGGFMHAIPAAVNNWFIRRRGFALGLIASAFGVGGLVTAPLLAIAVHNLGWRDASALSGLVILLVIPPIALLLRRSPESMGLLPDGDPPQGERGPTARRPSTTVANATRDFTVREALHTVSFWTLVLATSLRMPVIGSLVLHFVAIMVWKGMGEQTGAFLLGMLAGLGIPLRILLGWLGDRWYKPRVISLGLIPGIVALVLIVFSTATWHLLLLVTLLAMSDSMRPLNMAVVGDLFGRRNYATLRGLMGAFQSGGMFVLPVFAGAVYDWTESYTPVLLTFAALWVLASVAYGVLRPPRHPSERESASAA